MKFLLSDYCVSSEFRLGRLAGCRCLYMLPVELELRSGKTDVLSAATTGI